MKWVAKGEMHIGRQSYSCLGIDGFPVCGDLGASDRPSDAAVFTSYADALCSAAHASRMYVSDFRVVARLPAPSRVRVR